MNLLADFDVYMLLKSDGNKNGTVFMGVKIKIMDCDKKKGKLT